MQQGTLCSHGVLASNKGHNATPYRPIVGGHLIGCQAEAEVGGAHVRQAIDIKHIVRLETCGVYINSFVNKVKMQQTIL